MVCCRVRYLTFSDDTKHICHGKCYQSLCHRGNLARAQKKYEDDIASAAENDSESEYPSIDMNSVENTYKLFVEEKGVTTHPKISYKKDIINILLEKVPGINCAKRGQKPEIVFSAVTKEKLMTQMHEDFRVGDEMEAVFKVSQIIRREITETDDWHFTESFVDFSTPMKLQEFLKWVISGPHTNLNANRSRSDVETLNDLQVAVTYDEVERTTTRMAATIMDDINASTQGVHIPPFVKQGIRPLFAIDNIDLGRVAGSFHGADLLIAQRSEDGAPPIINGLKLDLAIEDNALQHALNLPNMNCDKHLLHFG
ncbi:hypothetical protein SK128_006539 [Halocaridina rubra]|uniref:Uncharacterized protein n=1 Tax=Halocaridina rubra TaxID=373956 RepID=A0AAN9A4X9_HALRR